MRLRGIDVSRLKWRLAWGLFVLAGLSSRAPADVAIVVGIQEYKSSSFPKLKGCENDARDIATALQKLHFKVHPLIGSQATYAAILAEFNKVKGSIKPNENFVFYFAGHGNLRPKGILAYDALKTGVNFLFPATLHSMVMGVGAASRTIILDSCFSGGLARAKGITTEFRTRSANTDDAPATSNDDDDGLKADDPVTYLVASQPNESAIEKDEPGPAHGVFTAALLPLLANPLNSWGNLRLAVQKQMETLLATSHDQQHAYLRPEMAYGTKLFSTEKFTVQPPKTVQDIFLTDHRVPDVFKFTATPNGTSQFPIGALIKLDFSASKPGYLIVMQNEGGAYSLVFPARKPDGSYDDIDHCRMGSTFTLPESDKILTFDQIAEDSVQCLLFTDRERAKAFLDTMVTVSDNAPLSEIATKQLNSTEALGDVYTQRMTYFIDGNLFGGSQPHDIQSLAKKLQDPSDARLKWLSGIINWKLADTSNLSLDAIGRRLLLRINIAIQDSNVFSPGHAQELYDEDAGISLRQETLNLLKSHSKTDLYKLNRWIIEDVFPENFQKYMVGGKRQ